MSASDKQGSLSFGAEAAAYERGRPSYPPEAIDWLTTTLRDSLQTDSATQEMPTSLKGPMVHDPLSPATRSRPDRTTSPWSPSLSPK